MSLNLSYLQEVEARLSEAKPANRATEGWDLKKYNLYYVYCIALLVKGKLGKQIPTGLILPL